MDDDLEKDPNNIPGGPAIKPRASVDSVGPDIVEPSPPENIPEEAPEEENSLAGTAKEAVKEKAKEEVEKRVLQVARKWAKKQLAAVASWVVGLFGGWEIAAIVIAIIIALVIIILAIVGWSKASGGSYGRTQAQGISVYSSTDMHDITEVLAHSNVVSGDPRLFYFNQGDPNWGGKPGQATGWSKIQEGTVVAKYRNKACALTSAAMISKYYGVREISPYTLGGYMAEQTGNMALNQSIWLTYTNKYLPYPKKIVSVPKNIESVKKEIAAGNPILAKGVAAFRAKEQHWVVIVGVSKDDGFLVLNDPSAEKSRGMSTRYSPAEELTNGKIKGLWVLHDK